MSRDFNSNPKTYRQYRNSMRMMSSDPNLKFDDNFTVGTE